MDKSKKIEEYKSKVLNSKEFHEFKSSASGNKLDHMIENLKSQRSVDESVKSKPAKAEINLSIALWKLVAEYIEGAELLSNFIVLIQDSQILQDSPKHAILNSRIIDEIKLIDENLKLMKHKVELVSALILVLEDKPAQG